MHAKINQNPKNILFTFRLFHFEGTTERTT